MGRQPPKASRCGQLIGPATPLARAPRRFPNGRRRRPQGRPPSARPRRLLPHGVTPRRPRQAGRGAVQWPRRVTTPPRSTPASSGRRETESSRAPGRQRLETPAGLSGKAARWVVVVGEHVSERLATAVALSRPCPVTTDTGARRRAAPRGVQAATTRHLDRRGPRRPPGATGRTAARRARTPPLTKETAPLLRHQPRARARSSGAPGAVAAGFRCALRRVPDTNPSSASLAKQRVGEGGREVRGGARGAAKASGVAPALRAVGEFQLKAVP